MNDADSNISWGLKTLNSYNLFFHSGITQNENFKSTYELNKNLSYSIQYLEFISKMLDKNLQSVICTELIKTSIIVGIGIVESILFYFIKSSNLQTFEKYEIIDTFTSNEKNVKNVKIRVETTLSRKLENPKELEMSLDSMLKKAKRYKLIGDDSDLYSELNKLRKLRNKVHLHAIEKDFDTDWHNFNVKEFKMIKRILKTLFYSDNFDYPRENKEKLFDFLN